MKSVFGFAVAIALCSITSSTFAQQCNKSGGRQPSMNSPGSTGSLSTQPNNSLYNNYSGGLNSSYTPNASQLLAYNNAANYQALMSQRMDRMLQAQMVNQVAAQRAALRKAQKARKEGKSDETIVTAER
jgi:hypothetical protein